MMTLELSVRDAPNCGVMFIIVIDDARLRLGHICSTGVILDDPHLSTFVYFQYSSYNFMAQNLSGEQTLGENIADNGGLKASYYAYRQWLKEQVTML